MGWRPSFWLSGSLGILRSVVWQSWFRDRPSEKPAFRRIEIKANRRMGRRPGTAACHGQGCLRDRNLLLLMLMYHCYCWGAYFYLSWIHTYLQVGRRLTEDQMKLGSALPPACGLLGVALGGFLSDRLAGATAASGPLFHRIGLPMEPESAWAAGLTSDAWAAVWLLAAGLGVMNGMLPVSWSLAVDLGREHSGAVSGAMNTADQIGSFLSSVALRLYGREFRQL